MSTLSSNTQFNPNLPQEMTVESLGRILRGTLALFSDPPPKVNIVGSHVKTFVVDLPCRAFPRFIGKKGATLMHWRYLFSMMGKLILEEIKIEATTPEFTGPQHTPFRADLSWDYSKMKEPFEAVINWFFPGAEIEVTNSGEIINIEVVVSRHGNIDLRGLSDSLTVIFRSISRPNGRVVNVSIWSEQ